MIIHVLFMDVLCHFFQTITNNVQIIISKKIFINEPIQEVVYRFYNSPPMNCKSWHSAVRLDTLHGKNSFIGNKTFHYSKGNTVLFDGIDVS